MSINLAAFLKKILVYFIMEKNLVFERFAILKTKNCLGCQCNALSQKDHDCLLNYFDDYYIQQALEELKEEQKISFHTYQVLYSDLIDHHQKQQQ